MPRKRTIAALAMFAAAAYCALPVYILSASLKPSRGACSVNDGPPPDLKVETLSFRSPSDGVRLAGWLLPARGRRAVVLVHGIDADAWAGAAPDLARAYHDAGFDVLLFDLRAHGRSDGPHITLGAMERGDIGAVVALLLARGIRPGEIGLHGTSYGAAMALLAAADSPAVGAVVADSAYADIRDVMASQVGKRTHVPGLVADWLLRPGIVAAARLLYDLDLADQAPERALPRIAPRPVLLIHGTRDTVIPPDHARRLKSHASDPGVELWMLDGKGHTEGVRSGRCNTVPSPDGARFLERVVSFLDAALERGRREIQPIQR